MNRHFNANSSKIFNGIFKFNSKLIYFNNNCKNYSTLKFIKFNNKNFSQSYRFGSKRYSSSTSSSSKGFGARFKELSKKYGWSAFGVYMGLSCIDFPLCFLLVHSAGADQIGEWEDNVKEWLGISSNKKDTQSLNIENLPVEDNSKDLNSSSSSLDQIYNPSTSISISISESSQENKPSKHKASIWTEMIIAYGIHKSLIFIRLPITAAITPYVVKTLRGWGFNVGSAALSQMTKSGVKKVGEKADLKRRFGSWFF